MRGGWPGMRQVRVVPGCRESRTTPPPRRPMSDVAIVDAVWDLAFSDAPVVQVRPGAIQVAHAPAPWWLEAATDACAYGALRVVSCRVCRPGHASLAFSLRGEGARARGRVWCGLVQGPRPILGDPPPPTSPVRQGFANRFRMDIMANRTQTFICGDPPAPWRRPGAGCTPEAAWLALFAADRPLPLGPALDFLFRPSQAFLADALVPALARLPAWTAPGPRVGVHLRTLSLDGR
jgi:hypothetical protein